MAWVVFTWILTAHVMCVSVFNLSWTLVKFDPRWEKLQRAWRLLSSKRAPSSSQTWPGCQASSLCTAQKRVLLCNERWNRAVLRAQELLQLLCWLNSEHTWKAVVPLVFMAPSHFICLFPWRWKIVCVKGWGCFLFLCCFEGSLRKP